MLDDFIFILCLSNSWLELHIFVALTIVGLILVAIVLQTHLRQFVVELHFLSIELSPGLKLLPLIRNIPNQPRLAISPFLLFRIGHLAFQDVVLVLEEREQFALDGQLDWTLAQVFIRSWVRY
jgi:hypothetical protein